MSEAKNFKRQRIQKPGRLSITIECSDDLGGDEIIQMEAVIEAQVCLLQRKTHGYTAEQVAAWQSAA